VLFEAQVKLLERYNSDFQSRHVEASRSGRLLNRDTFCWGTQYFRVQGRTRWHTAPDELQVDLDTFMAFYNFRRTHQGYRVAGGTPAKALYDLISEHWLLPPMSDAA
jgi:hypothetical protein